jgi:hypothetical protein
LLALAFLGEPPSARHQVAHNDGNPRNNHLSNLRWATPSENSMDRRLHGTVPDRKGERHPMVKLNDQLVSKLRNRRSGMTYPDMAKRYRIPKPARCMTPLLEPPGVIYLGPLDGAVKQMHQH